MDDHGHVPIDDGTILAWLEGGPADLPEAARSRRVPADEECVKIMHRGGYEHFVLVPANGDGERAPERGRVFHWRTRTRIAE